MLNVVPVASKIGEKVGLASRPKPSVKFLYILPLSRGCAPDPLFLDVMVIRDLTLGCSFDFLSHEFALLLLYLRTELEGVQTQIDEALFSGVLNTLSSFFMVL